MEFKERYVNPLTDFGFKKLFGSEPNKDILVDFLNQLLPEKHKIVELTYGKNEGLAAIEYERKVIFDLYCTNQNGDRFIVEVQKAKFNYFIDRSVYYSTFPIQEQAKQGTWDFDLAAVYTVGILDFEFRDSEAKPDCLTVAKLRDEDCQVIYDKLTYIYIELPKFKKSLEELESRFDQWVYLLRHLVELDERPVGLKDRVFEKFFEAAEIARYSKEELQVYRQSKKHLNDWFAAEDTAREEGKAEGELNKARETARKMLLDGLPTDTVAKYTDLSVEEIERIQRGLKG